MTTTAVKTSLKVNMSSFKLYHVYQDPLILSNATVCRVKRWRRIRRRVFTSFISSFTSCCTLDVKEVIYQAWDAVFHHQMKHQEESWKYDAQRSIFDQLRGVSSGDEIVSNAWYYFSNKMILEREIKGAKMTVFHPISKHSLNIFFPFYFLNELLMSLRSVNQRMLHVQSCCFALKTNCFLFSRCRRCGSRQRTNKQQIDHNFLHWLHYHSL